MPVLSTVAAACARAWGFTSGFVYDAPVPSLFLDFASTTTLDSRITFTRATNGTYFDASGVLQTASSGVARFDHRLEGGVWVNKGLLIEEQRTNFSHRSEEIDNAYWTKQNVTVTANDIAAPDGTTTAEKLLETTTNGSHRFFTATPISIDMTTNNYSGSVFVKGGLGRVRGVIQILNTSTANSFFTSFNIDNLSASLSAGGTGVNVGASVQDVGDGWYRVSVSGRTGANGSHQLICYIATDVGSTNYAGDVTKGLYWWGIQFEQGSFSTSYIKTVSANVTRNGDVAEMTSTDFSSWYNQSEGTIFCQAQYTGFNASTSNPRFWEISDGGTSERHFLTNASTLTPAGAFRYGVVDGGVVQATIDSSFAATTNQTYKTAAAYKVDDFGLGIDGSLIGTDTSGTIPTPNKLTLGTNYSGTALTNQNVLNGHIAEFAYWPTRLPNNALKFLSANGYDNDGLSLILNFDQTTVLDPRITFTRATNGTYFDSAGVLQTASSGVARFDHRLESSVWVNKGLLIEEQRTNTFLQSENFGTTWVNVNSAESLDATTAPDGNTTADKITETATTGSHGVYQTASITSGSTYTMSLFVKASERSVCAMTMGSGGFGANQQVVFNLSTVTASVIAGTPSGYGIIDVGNGWYRVYITATATATATPQMNISMSDGTLSYLGVVGEGMFMWGAQLEVGAFPTSYIATTAASVTRNADLAVMTGTDFSDWYNQTEGTVLWQGDFIGVTTASSRCFTLSDNTISERIILIARSDFFRATGIDGGVNQFEIDDVGVVANQTYGAALAIKLNDIAFAVDGSLIGTDTSATLPTVDRFFLGANFNGTAGFLNGHIAKAYYWNTRKSNTFLQSITG